MVWTLLSNEREVSVSDLRKELGFVILAQLHKTYWRSELDSIGTDPGQTAAKMLKQLRQFENSQLFPILHKIRKLEKRFYECEPGLTDMETAMGGHPKRPYNKVCDLVKDLIQYGSTAARRPTIPYTCEALSLRFTRS